MIELKASTKGGARWINAARKNNEGRNLSDIYSSWSARKDAAFNNCLYCYYCDKGENFHIISHNSNFFVLAWEQIYGNEPVLRIETGRNTYIIYLNK